MTQKKHQPEFSSFYADPAVAGDYDRARAATWKNQIVRAVEREFFANAVASAADILELGAGTGEITQMLARIGRVRAYDISPAMLAEAAKKLPADRVELRTLDMFDLGSETGEFDAVVASRVFLHLGPAELSRMIGLCRDKLRPGGRLVFDLQRPSLLRRGLALFEGHKVKNPNYSQRLIAEALGPGISLERLSAFDHWLPLLPLAAFRGPCPDALKNGAAGLEGALANLPLFAGRWGVVCRRS